MSLAACIMRWPWTTREPGWCRLFGQVVLEHRAGRLLDLQEQRVLLVASLEQDDEGARADAADADHLARHVDDLELLEQVAPVALQRRPVGAELGMDVVLELIRGEAVGAEVELAQRDDDRRLADDAVLAVDDLGELGERLQAVARVRLGGDLLGAPRGGLGRLLLRLALLGSPPPS